VRAARSAAWRKPVVAPCSRYAAPPVEQPQHEARSAARHRAGHRIRHGGADRSVMTEARKVGRELGALPALEGLRASNPPLALGQKRANQDRPVSHVPERAMRGAYNYEAPQGITALEIPPIIQSTSSREPSLRRVPAAISSSAGLSRARRGRSAHSAGRVYPPLGKCTTVRLDCGPDSSS